MRSNRASPQSWQQRQPSPVGLGAFLFEQRESFCGHYSSAAGLKLGGKNCARIQGQIG